MIEKIRELDGSFHFKDQEGRRYSRIVAGLSFPTSKPGFIAVVAEDYYEDIDLKCRHLWALAEAEESDIEQLFKRCIDLRERYWVERVIGDTGNESVMALLYTFNKGLDGARALNLYDASFPDDLTYHIQLIKNSTRFNNILHLNQCNTLRGHLSSITLEDASHGKASDYTAVMALGYVVSYITDHPKDPVADRIKQHTQDKGYNPLTYGLDIA